MLRQSAFIFVVFLFAFSVLLGCPSGQDDIKSGQDDVKSAQDDVKSGQDDVKLAQDDVQQWNLPEGAVRRLGISVLKVYHKVFNSCKFFG